MTANTGRLTDSPYTVVLGIAQDAGYPATGCRRPCCARVWAEPVLRRHVASLGIVDPRSQERWLVDCTPDFRAQRQMFDQVAFAATTPGITGILLTHAHIGHYTGLVQLGREAMDTRLVPVYVMPRMRSFLERNQPWKQLVADGNIELNDLSDGQTVYLSERVKVTPLLVPHRDENSETVGFKIEGPERSVIDLPDTDNWQDWKQPIETAIASVDLAYLDGTFYSEGELGSRNMAEIPHPLVTESVERFQRLPGSERQKIRFLHFNHTNPLLDTSSLATHTLAISGLGVALEGELFPL